MLHIIVKVLFQVIRNACLFVFTSEDIIFMWDYLAEKYWEERVERAWYGKAELNVQRYGTGKIIKGFSHCEEHREADQKRQSLRKHCHSQLRSPSTFVFTAALFPQHFTILN